MSHIFDALSKQRAGKAADPAASIAPSGASTAPLPEMFDPKRDRELESLRQRLLMELGLDHPPAIVLTGAVAGEGATTLSLHFARGLAEAEQRPVLLVDGDFARSRKSLTGALEASATPRPGFGDLLAERAEIEAVVLATEHPYLHFLPSGTAPGQTTDFARPERVQKVMRELAKHYAFVLIDAAPPLDAPETGPLGAGTDGVVLVVRASRLRREVVQKAVFNLNKARCRVLGVILNDRRYPIPDFLYRRI